MKKYSVLLLFIAFFTGCFNDLIKEPKDLIDKNKMINILYDLSLLEAMKIENTGTLDTFKDNSSEYVFKKYKIDSLQFAKSNKFYASDYKEYEEMYKMVKAKLEIKKTKVLGLIKAQTKRDMLRSSKIQKVNINLVK